MANDYANTYRRVRTSSPTVNVNWLQREFPDPEDQREYARERIALVVSEAIANAMERSGARRIDLAESLGKTKGHISQVLSGRRNMTLHTLSDILWACGEELEDLYSIPLGQVACSPESANEWHLALKARGALMELGIDSIDETSKQHETWEWPVFQDLDSAVIDHCHSHPEVNADLATAA